MFGGIIPAVPSIFDERERFKVDETCKVVDFLCDSGINGVALNLLGGEFYKLSQEEKMLSLNKVIEHIGGKVLVYAGISEPSTLLSCEMAKMAEDAGSDSLIAMPPYYNPLGKIDSKSIYEHFSRICSSVDIPLIIQDFGLGIPSKIIYKLKNEFSNIAGIKLEGRSTGKTLSRISDMRSLFGNEFCILGGMLGRNLTKEMKAGSSGTIPGSSVADFLVKIYSGIKQGNSSVDPRTSEKLIQLTNIELSDLRHFVYFEKLILKKRGVITNVTCREPFSQPRKQKIESLNRIVESLFSLPS